MTSQDGTSRESLEELAELRKFVHDHGWTIAIHGSCQRDLDFVLVPWSLPYPTEVGVMVEFMAKEFDRFAEGPTWKPHGRLAYALHSRKPNRRYWDMSFVDPRNAIGRAFK